MKSTNVSWVVVTLTALVCLTLAACESTTESASSPPGELPRTENGASPRINAATYAAHGELLERRGDYARAAEQYRQALTLNSGATSTRNRLGVTLNKLGEHAAATEQFRAAIEAQPEQAYLQNNLGFSLYLEGENEEAAEVLARAVELDPSFRRARMNYAVVLAQLERYDDALAQFSEAGPLGDAYFNLGVVQAQKGAFVAAAGSFEQALANDPGLDAARDQLREIARLSAVEERGEQVNYEMKVATGDTGLDQPKLTASATELEPIPTPVPVATATPTDEPQESITPLPPPVEPRESQDSTTVVAATETAPIESTDMTPEELPSSPPMPATPVLDPRSSAVPPIDATAVRVANSLVSAPPAEPSVSGYASIALERDPWAEFFVTSPQGAVRPSTAARVAPR